jgi:hypothetical protein
MSEGAAAAREAGEPMGEPTQAAKDQWQTWLTRAAAALEAGEAPTSRAAQELATEIATAFGTSRAEAADRIEQGTDTRAERYWQLMATINDWPQWPAQVPNAEWLAAALRTGS